MIRLIAEWMEQQELLKIASKRIEINIKLFEYDRIITPGWPLLQKM